MEVEYLLTGNRRDVTDTVAVSAVSTGRAVPIKNGRTDQTTAMVLCGRDAPSVKNFGGKGPGYPVLAYKMCGRIVSDQGGSLPEAACRPHGRCEDADYRCGNCFNRQ